ncbi:Sensor protein kinase WalK [Geobacteraceae bacterium]|nr:Sensor protein kinase WalK [Geobacteraceae bacterium]
MVGPGTNYPTLVVATDGKIVEANDAFTALSGYRAEAVTGRFFQEVIQCGSANRDIASIGTFSGVDLRKASGAQLSLLAVVSPVLDQTLTPYRYIVKLTECREIPEVAQALAAIESRMEVSEQEQQTFVSSVSHDLRSPVVSIKGFTGELRGLTENFMRQIGASPGLSPESEALLTQYREEMFEAIGFVESSAKRVERLVNLLVVFSKLERIPLNDQRVDMANLIRSIVTSMRHRIGQKECQISMEALFPCLMIDPTVAERIFGNILDNAVKYLDPSRPGSITIKAGENDREVIFSVRDNGIGIAEYNRHKVFMFFRRATDLDIPGDGVGMPLARALLKRYRGRIWFESQEGRGTTFHVAFPKTLVV